MKNTSIERNDRREIFGWIVYDWANSVFFTTVVSVLVGKYITDIAQKAVGENGVVIALGGYDLVTAKSLFPYSVGLSVFLQIFFLPLLGAIADYTHLKKTFMAFFCFLGVIACCLLFFVDTNLYLMGSVLFIVSNLGAGASIVFYNSYLSDITTEDQRDKVSSWGFAAGYASGVLMLIFNLIFLSNCEKWGISTRLAVRICLLIAGLWWGAFSLITFTYLRRRQPVQAVPEDQHYIAAGLGQLVQTFRDLFRLKHTLHFLIGYLLYNDGIQTVISVSSIYIVQEVLMKIPTIPDGDYDSILIIAFLIAQVVAIFGSLVFERIAHFTSSKSAIIVSLVLWSAIVIYAYEFLHTLNEAYFMSGLIGLVLGGSQALSRSLFSQMIPAGRESAFFGIYEISERGTSWIGPIVFGLVAQFTNSYRPAILALIVFFVGGSLVLAFTNVKQAIHMAGNQTPDEAAA